MSEIADDARVTLLLADYAVADAVKKVNILGAGWQLAGLQQNTGMTSPQTVVVFVDLPPQHNNEQFAMSLTLLDESGQAVEVPGPTGEQQPLRISQLCKAEEPVFPGQNVPSNVVFSHLQWVVQFAGGIPLPPSQLYTWQVEIDGNAPKAWAASFYVPGPKPKPVLG
jgi:hypothetical protein